MPLLRRTPAKAAYFYERPLPVAPRECDVTQYVEINAVVGWQRTMLCRQPDA